MKRSILCVLMAAAFLFCTRSLAITGDSNQDGIIALDETGELVAMLQTRLRELDYFHFKPTGRYQSMTRNAVIEFQKNQTSPDGAPIIADGTFGQQSMQILFSEKAIRSPIAQDVHIPIGDRANGQQTQNGSLVAWDEIKSRLVTGQSYTLTDYNTGVTFSMVYTGGENHAEMECATAMDATQYKQAFGGEYNYSKRAMLISIDSELIACSLQGQPHGDDTIARNDMDGHACLFFDGSLSHVGSLIDAEHINNIYTAAGRS